MNSLASPLRYSPSMEQPAADEAATNQELIETLRTISETTLRDSGRAMRAVHAKSHGILHGHLTVLDAPTPTLRQGLFAKPASFPVVMRLSTPPGDILADSVSTPRGLAIKVIGVEGERLPGSESDTTQDFVMVNGPAFVAPDAGTFLKTLKLLAATTDKAEGAKKVLSGVLRGTEKLVESLGGKSPTLISMGGHPETHILGESFFTQVPLRCGDYVAKIRVVPVSAELRALKDQPLAINGKPFALREAVVAFFARHPAEWEMQVQLCRDPGKNPIEDASVIWPEDDNPYLPVARLTVPAQVAWDDDSEAEEDALMFSPWHGIEAHRPLGSVMRARKPTYEASAEFRSRHSGCPIHEPRDTESRAGGPEPSRSPSFAAHGNTGPR